MLPYEKSNLEELLFTNSKTDSQSQFDLKWFVFYTYPRSEKVVYKDLLMRGFNVFLPMTKTLKVWKNRQKKYIEQVLFPGYIFIYTRPSELYFITQIPKIVTYIKCSGKPSVISSKEIELVKKIICLQEEVSVETKFYEGEEVRILNGPLAGYEGILVEQNGRKKIEIKIKEVCCTILIDMNLNNIEKIQEVENLGN